MYVRICDHYQIVCIFKVEVNALQDLLEEREHSYDLLVQINRDQEIKIDALLAEKDNVIPRISKTSYHSNGIEVRMNVTKYFQ